MAQQPFVAKIIGIPHIPSVTEVNVRSGPGQNFDMMFKSPVGTSELLALEVRPDAENKALSNKIYQWFRLTFPNGQAGWVRDDLIEVQGDGMTLGYGILTTPAVAFSLTRARVLAPGQEITPAGTTSTSATTTFTASTSITPVGQPTATSIAPPPSSNTPTVVSQPTQPAVTVVSPAISTTSAGPALAVCMGKTGANVRPGPGTHFEPPLGRINYMQEAPILDAKPSQTPGDPFKWVKISFLGKEGWIREDFTRLKGDFEKFGLGYLDQYPNPTVNSEWQRDFNLDANFAVVHHGWDHSGKIGEPILAGPKGGLVIQVAFCQKCGDMGRSAVDAGFAVSDSRVLNDQGWNFGYGHFVNVRYHHAILPASTQRRLAEMGKSGWHLFVNYAHLSRILVTDGQSLIPNQPVGLLGNSGNSTGAHLHLEVRAHPNENERSWARMREGLMSPAILYGR